MSSHSFETKWDLQRNYIFSSKLNSILKTLYQNLQDIEEHRPSDLHWVKLKVMFYSFGLIPSKQWWLKMFWLYALALSSESKNNLHNKFADWLKPKDIFVCLLLWIMKKHTNGSPFGICCSLGWTRTCMHPFPLLGHLALPIFLVTGLLSHRPLIWKYELICYEFDWSL